MIALAKGFGEAITLVREKEQGTILQLYASSLSAWELLLGKSLAYTLVGLGEALILFIVGFLLFQVRVIGDPTPLIIGTPIFIWVSVQLGLIIGIFTTTQSAAVQAIGTIKVLTAFLLAGFLFPLNTVPFPFSIASYLVPVRYYIELCRDVFVRGSGWFGTWHLIGALLLLGIVEFAMALPVRLRPSLGGECDECNYRDIFYLYLHRRCLLLNYIEVALGYLLVVCRKPLQKCKVRCKMESLGHPFDI